MLEETRKITAHLPAHLMESAMAETGKGITETLREGLKVLATRRAYRQLRALRGKIKLDIDLKALREDKR